MTRLLLLDGHSLAYRAFFALPAENFSTATGQHTNAVYGFTSMLINVLRDEQPTHVAVAFDLSRQTFRTQEYAEYKAGRAKTPDEFAGQVSLVQEVLDAMGIAHVGVEGFEADDVIATLATQAGQQGMEVLICSGDRDALQLVDDRTTVLYPRKGVSDLARMTPEAVEEKYGVRPERYQDLAAMVGESADNLPGVPGVGPKTAAKWLGLHGDLGGIVDAADTIKGKAGQSFRDHLDQVLRNRRLNQLVRDVELPLALDDTAWDTFDREKVHEVFDALEFRVLRDRMFEYLGQEGAETADALEVEAELVAPGALADWIAAHGTGLVGLEMVFPAPPSVAGRHRTEPTGIALAAGEGDDAVTGWFDLAGRTPADEEALQGLFTAGAEHLAVHDLKRVVHGARVIGLQLDAVAVDTALSAYLVRPDQRSYDLADLCLRHLQRELPAVEEDGGAEALFDASEVDGSTDGLTTAARTAAIRAVAVRELAPVLAQEVEAVGAAGLARDLEIPLARHLVTMEATGIAVDSDQLAALEEDFAEQVAAAQADAHAAIEDDSVNLGSPKQLQEVLFERLGLPKTKKTKTGWTTDADALVWLSAQAEEGSAAEAFLSALLRHRDVTRLRSTVQGLQKSVDEDGRIHTTYQQTIAATGRLSSVDPNLQNIPIRTEAGRRIREVFVVGEGYEQLMSADYSQVEMRIMAHLSGDAGLIQAFNEGEDLHDFVGARVFGVPADEVTPEMRAKVKAMSYGLAYGLSAFGLSKQLGISTPEATALMDEYFARFGGVRDYLREVVDEARKGGYTQTMLGRRRPLPDLASTNRQRREMAERMALNAPIQGSAADLMKLAMLRVEDRLAAEGLRSRVLLQVHDELVLEVAPGEVEATEQLVREAMGSAVELDVPLDVSIGTGRSWHDAAH
ncbi:DNA polymerase I [Kytococcus schroeteri]|uniref:DNA polymerase I n=1 Tax=Kytococcus schroeteri TaxID=138300 RepID=UPI001143C030|nr:DNA polymerase I [Kytococcus schroeteri]